MTAGSSALPTIAIIGGGASGVLTAIHLLRHNTDPRLRVSLYEAGQAAARGVAYGTLDPRHLLNVRARDMSAFPDEPGDLLAWAAATGRAADPAEFIQRRVYAQYLQETLDDVADARLDIKLRRVTDLVATADGFEVRADRASESVGAVVLAYGNLPPARLTFDGSEVPDASWHQQDPWALEAFARLRSDATIVLVGTGLTAVDTAITLLGDDERRRVIMTSRHGLLPEPHIEPLSTAWVSPIPAGPLTADDLAVLLRTQIRLAARQGVDWRAVVDGLRAPTQGLWQRLDSDERRRFLALYARHWEVRRHRMAPEIVATLDAHRQSGRLTMVKGGIRSVVDKGKRCAVAFGDPAVDEVAADALINCTGPMTDVIRSTNPLLVVLRARNLLAPDPLALGLACTPDGQLIDASGATVPGLFAVGPPRKGTLYESTAVPEIRLQAADLASQLSSRLAG